MSDQIAPSGTSWWLEEAMAAEQREGVLPPPPSGPLPETGVDVAIVGGGFTGLWTALALRQRAPELSVAVVEAGVCGSGASGKNGGKVHGYWSQLPHLTATFGPDAALAIARAGTQAQDALRAFATAGTYDVWWREGGNVRVATTPEQEAKLRGYVETARRLGVPDTARSLSAGEVAGLCASPVFRSGVLFAEGATVQPARLARALRREAMAAGIAVHENTPVVGLDRGNPSRLRTARGDIVARKVVLATNAALGREPSISPFLSVFSSYAAISRPAAGALASMGWNTDVSFADMRMFVHYFRRTPDGRALMGAGAGPVAYANRSEAVGMTGSAEGAGRAIAGMRHLLPDLMNAVPAERVWGGAIDVASDRLPFVGSLRGGDVFYACGFSGHGVNPTFIVAQCLAALVAGQHHPWLDLPFYRRQMPRLPPEPLRYLGAAAVRRAILACEDAEENGRAPSAFARTVAGLPARLGLRIGVR
ncbi:NAD(P)/FAD-dependent oxidoreductase [Pseudochelatococcus lubricantis]|uniref:NAD(P)/FAD-dependent oxidoreductase n=1 Tax=Pseudochelatococcus lubricantis TaxID=1538102 RepID=UPI0035EAB2D9